MKDKTICPKLTSLFSCRSTDGGHREGDSDSACVKTALDYFPPVCLADGLYMRGDADR
jgi:hypothetical protein